MSLQPKDLTPKERLALLDACDIALKLGELADPEELFLGEYSASQDAFHVQPLAEALKENRRRAALKDHSNDWIPLALGTAAQVRQVIAVVWRVQRQRS